MAQELTHTDAYKFTEQSDADIMTMVNEGLEGTEGKVLDNPADVTAVPQVDGADGGGGDGKPVTPKADNDPPAFYQDDTGKWHRPDGSFASNEEAEIAAAELEGVEAGGAATGEGAAAPAAGAEGKPAAGAEPIHDFQVVKSKLAGLEFQVKASDGTPVSEFPDLTFKFQANGKEIEAPLDKVVRLAQMGVYNEQREADVAQARTILSQRDTELETLRNANAEYEQYFEQFMRDDQFLANARAQYARQNSPEARLAAERQRLEMERAQMVHQQQLGQAQSYVTNRVAPAVERVGANNPLVSNEEILGKMQQLTAPLLVNGVLPPDRLFDVMRIVESDLTSWAEDRNASRAQTTAATEKRARRQIDAARVEAAMAKRQLARVASPAAAAGRAGPAGTGTGASRKANPSVEDWMQDEFGIEKWGAAR